MRRKTDAAGNLQVSGVRALEVNNRYERLRSFNQKSTQDWYSMVPGELSPKWDTVGSGSFTWHHH
jgi:hypothetical protein